MLKTTKKLLITTSILSTILPAAGAFGAGGAVATPVPGVANKANMHQGHHWSINREIRNGDSIRVNVDNVNMISNNALPVLKLSNVYVNSNNSSIEITSGSAYVNRKLHINNIIDDVAGSNRSIAIIINKESTLVLEGNDISGLRAINIARSGTLIFDSAINYQGNITGAEVYGGVVNVRNKVKLTGEASNFLLVNVKDGKELTLTNKFAPVEFSLVGSAKAIVDSSNNNIILDTNVNGNAMFPQEDGSGILELKGVNLITLNKDIGSAEDRLGKIIVNDNTNVEFKQEVHAKEFKVGWDSNISFDNILDLIKVNNAGQEKDIGDLTFVGDGVISFKNGLRGNVKTENNDEGRLSFEGAGQVKGGIGSIDHRIKSVAFGGHAYDLYGDIHAQQAIFDSSTINVKHDLTISADVIEIEDTVLNLRDGNVLELHNPHFVGEIEVNAQAGAATPLLLLHGNLAFELNNAEITINGANPNQVVISVADKDRDFVIGHISNENAATFVGTLTNDQLNAAQDFANARLAIDKDLVLWRRELQDTRTELAQADSNLRVAQSALANALDQNAARIALYNARLEVARLQSLATCIENKTPQDQTGIIIATAIQQEQYQIDLEEAAIAAVHAGGGGGAAANPAGGGAGGGAAANPAAVHAGGGGGAAANPAGGGAGGGAAANPAAVVERQELEMVEERARDNNPNNNPAENNIAAVQEGGIRERYSEQERERADSAITNVAFDQVQAPAPIITEEAYVPVLNTNLVRGLSLVANGMDSNIEIHDPKAIMYAKELKDAVVKEVASVISFDTKNAVNVANQLDIEGVNIASDSNIGLSRNDEALKSMSKQEQAVLYVASMQKVDAGKRKELQNEEVKKVTGKASVSSGALEALSSVVGSRMDSAVALAAGDEDRKILQGAWVSGLYGSSNQKTSATQVGYKGNSSGASLGFDFNLSDDALLGIAYGNVQSNIKYGAEGDTTKAKSHVMSLYAQGKVAENWLLQGVVSGAKSRVTSKDVVSIADRSVAKGKFNSTSLNVEGNVGYKLALANNFVAVPNIGLRYGSNKDGAYTEKGAGVHNKKVESRTNNTLTGIFGTKLMVTHRVSDDTSITPSLNASLEYGFKNKPSKVKAKFVWADSYFENKAKTKAPKIGYNVGASVLAKHNNIEVLAGYNHHISGKYSSNQGSLKLKLLF